MLLDTRGGKSAFPCAQARPAGRHHSGEGEGEGEEEGEGAVRDPQLGMPGTGRALVLLSARATRSIVKVCELRRGPSMA